METGDHSTNGASSKSHKNKRNLLYLVTAAIMIVTVLGSCEKDGFPTPVAVTGVTLNKTTVTLGVGVSDSLIATVLPQNASNKIVSFSSSAPDVATVNNAGLVEAVSMGTATITATTANGNHTATCVVTVTFAPSSGIILNKDLLTLFVGDTATLTATVQPATALNTFTWSNSSESVASFDTAKGLITAKSLGTTTITATTGDGNHKATCTVTVIPKQRQMSMVTSKSGEVKIYLEGFGSATVDWGDGTKNTYALSGWLNHIYSGTSKHLITITGEKITFLSCNENELTSLDVSKNPALTILICQANQLTSLDISNNIAIKTLGCGGYYVGNKLIANQITSLDISRNPELIDLECGSNPLSRLDVSNNPVLKYLTCVNLQITSLDVSKNTVLEYLHCGWNELTSLDISSNPALTELECSNTPLSRLDVSKKTALTHLNCQATQITSLDVSKNIALTELLCNYTKITGLDVSKNTALTKLNCCNNQIASLDVSKNTVLETLCCGWNQLKSLDVHNNTALKLLQCASNELSSLDVSGLDGLTDLYCYGTKMDVTALNALFSSLNSTAGLKTIYIGINPAYKDCNRSIATNKGWIVNDGF